MPAIFQRSILYAQNFLTSSCLVDALLDRCSFEPSDILYEIGPGKGIITDRLASRCSQVVAIEKDAQLVRRCVVDSMVSPTLPFTRATFYISACPILTTRSLQAFLSISPL